LKILKIGGSLITDKGENVFEIAKEEIIERVAEQLHGDVIVVHGVGSFGHPHVRRFGLTVEGISKTHLACLRLNTIFCSKLENAGLYPIPIHPLEFFSNPNYDFLRDLVSMGFTPVLHGDIVYDNGFRVMSGDEVVRLLAENIRAERVGFACDTAVVINGEVVREINPRNFGEIIKKVGTASNKEDVTGGMRGKILEGYRIAEICDVFIFDGREENAIRRFLRGEEVGTKITKRF